MDQPHGKPKKLNLLMSNEGLDDAFSVLTGAPDGECDRETAGIVDWYASKRRVQVSIAHVALKC